MLNINLSWSALLVILVSCFTASGYINPIIPGVNPDPSILRIGRDYWLVVSSFEFTPGIPIYHSTDLINWTLHSHALTRPSQLSMYMVPQSLGKSGNLEPRTDGKEALEIPWSRVLLTASWLQECGRPRYGTTKDGIISHRVCVTALFSKLFADTIPRKIGQLSNHISTRILCLVGQHSFRSVVRPCVL